MSATASTVDPDSRRSSIGHLSIGELRAAFYAERAREERLCAVLIAQAIEREVRLLAHAEALLEAERARSRRCCSIA